MKDLKLAKTMHPRTPKTRNSGDLTLVLDGSVKQDLGHAGHVTVERRIESIKLIETAHDARPGELLLDGADSTNDVGEVGDAIAFEDGRVDREEDGKDLCDDALVWWVGLGQAESLQNSLSGFDGRQTFDAQLDEKVCDVLFLLELELGQSLTNGVGCSIGSHFVSDRIEKTLTLSWMQDGSARVGIGEERL